MGLFQHKGPTRKSVSDDAEEAVEQLFDDKFREEIRQHGRTYFERVINENAELFKQDLDATIAHINTELRQHIARQLDRQFTDIGRVNAELRESIVKRLDEQFTKYSQTMKHAQDKALVSLERSAKDLESQHSQLSATLEKSFAHQDAMMATAVGEGKKRIDAMKESQEEAIKSMTESIKALREQHHLLSKMLQDSVNEQQEMILNTFQDNMASVIEHHLATALSDQYDLKAQLPAIIEQMEANKQAIMDDMKL